MDGTLEKGLKMILVITRMNLSPAVNSESSVTPADLSLLLTWGLLAKITCCLIGVSVVSLDINVGLGLSLSETESPASSVAVIYTTIDKCKRGTMAGKFILPAKSLETITFLIYLIICKKIS